METKSEDTTVEGTADTENQNTLDSWLHGLSPEQLEEVKATVNTVAEKRTEPNYGGMSDVEFRDQVSKKFGFSPI